MAGKAICPCNNSFTSIPLYKKERGETNMYGQHLDNSKSYLENMTTDINLSRRSVEGYRAYQMASQLLSNYHSTRPKKFDPRPEVGEQQQRCFNLTRVYSDQRGMHQFMSTLDDARRQYKLRLF